MTPKTTPISIIEKFFEFELTTKSLKKFDEVSSDKWLDFAKTYLRQMEGDFSGDFIEPNPSKKEVRLYFEPELRHRWEAVTAAKYERTPLLGVNLDPGPQEANTPEQVSRYLEPLKSHLLLADSLYLSDQFYRTFESLADAVPRYGWPDSGWAGYVAASVERIKGWLPILIHLRHFIESGALVFMPYYLTPAFPTELSSWDAKAPTQFQEARSNLRLRADPSADPAPEPPEIDFEHFFEPPKIPPGGYPPDYQRLRTDEAMTAWMNGRLLGLDPVLPNKASTAWASRLYFADAPDLEDGGADLMSIEILLSDKELSIDKLWRIREDKDVFQEIKATVSECKKYVDTELGAGASRKAISKDCYNLVRDKLEKQKRKSKLRFIDNTASRMAVSCVLGIALMPLAPVWGALAGGALGELVKPESLVEQLEKRDKGHRAYSYLLTVF